MAETLGEITWRSLPNPFNVTEGIIGRASGRSTDIIQIITGGQSALILTGAPRIGKTTLIRYLYGSPGSRWSWRNELVSLRHHFKLNDIHFVQVNLVPTEDIENKDKLLGFFVKQCMTALQPLQQQDELKPSTNLKELYKLMRILRNENPHARYFIMLDTIERLERLGMQLFEQLNIDGSQAQTEQERGIALLERCGAIRVLIDLLDEFRNFGVIFSLRSLPRPKIDDQFTHVSADLARFTAMTLQIFTHADATGLVGQEPEDFGTEWAEIFKNLGGKRIFSLTERDWLLEQAGTHPYLLQQFCSHTFHFKQEYAFRHKSWTELQENDKKQLVEERINDILSTFLAYIWKRLQEALGKTNVGLRSKFYNFIESLTQSSTNYEIDPVTWNDLGPELRYILTSEGIVRYDPIQPIYRPGIILCQYLAQKVKEIHVQASTQVVSSVPSRNYLLRITQPEHPQQTMALTELEYRLLKTLVQHPGHNTEADLMKGAWDKMIERSTFTQRMHHLRKKLRDNCGGIEIIENRYGGQYSLNYPGWLQLD